jgi:hypothetical protein
MRHFIAYHNTEKMGRPLHDGEPLRLLTSKSVDRLVGNIVWFITGEGADERRYALGSVFKVSEVGDAAEQGFKHFASGPGHVFRPPIVLNDEGWFPALIQKMGNFGLGVQEVTDDRVIAALKSHATAAGAAVV